MSHSSTPAPVRALLYSTLLALLATGCASARSLEARLPPMALAAEAVSVPEPPPILTENHFSRDHAGSISESALRQVLASPVFLEEQARVGIVPVQSAYALDMEVPLTAVPATLTEALEGSGEFELASELSTDFPVGRSISGLRELAARYRCDYLLLYRHRFVDSTSLNPVAWSYLTIVGALFLPGHTLHSAGVLEATLFDVKTGTLLFTVHERIHGEEQVTVWRGEQETQRLQRQLLESAAQGLADQVLVKVRRLVAARPAPSEKSSGPVVSSRPEPELAPAR